MYIHITVVYIHRDMPLPVGVGRYLHILFVCLLISWYTYLPLSPSETYFMNYFMPVHRLYIGIISIWWLYLHIFVKYIQTRKYISSLSVVQLSLFYSHLTNTIKGFWHLLQPVPVVSCVSKNKYHALHQRLPK